MLTNISNNMFVSIKKTKMPTIIKNCGCENKFQDVNYGIGKRVFNIAGKSNESAVCTVCGKQISMTRTTPTEKLSEKTKK